MIMTLLRYVTMIDSFYGHCPLSEVYCTYMKLALFLSSDNCHYTENAINTFLY